MASKNSCSSNYAEFKKEGIWQYYLREKNGQTAKCTLCNEVLKTTGGSTKGLHTHLSSKHDINLLKRKETPTVTAQISAQQKSEGPMDKFFRSCLDQSLSATVARMAACDGLSFKVFVTSADLRRALGALGFNPLPTSPHTFRSLVMEHGEKIREYITNELTHRKNNGQCFSLTFDEWTSVRNRRFLNINVHEQGPKFWNLGLVRVTGSMPAEKCVDLIESKLNEFGLTLTDDIVSICTDGASVMKKVGKLIKPEQQLCYAHGCHLAVHDVLYKPSGSSGKNRPNIDADATDPINADEIYDIDNGEEADLNEEEDEERFDVAESYDIAELSNEYNDAIAKVRKIVKCFRRSPTKNDDNLQKYVKEEIGHELNLILDVKTRWNSLVDMLQRFVKIRTSIQKALIDIKMPMQLTDEEFTMIEDLVKTLEPVKLAVEALCRRDTNLITAEAALLFCIRQLSKQSSAIAKAMALALEDRVKERRALHAGVLHYLHNPNTTGSDIFPIPSRAVIRKFILGLLIRLDNCYDSITETERSTENENGEENASKLF